MRRLVPVVLLALVGCQPAKGLPVTPDAKPSVARKDVPAVVRAGTTLVGLDGASLVGLDGASLVGQDAAGLIGDGGGTLIAGSVRGPARLVGQDGASSPLIGDGGGTLVGAGGSTLIGDGGGTLIGDGGGTLIGDGGGTLRPAARRVLALAQEPVVGVRVYLRDAVGRYVVGADGKLLAALCDARGKFTFPGLRTQTNLVAVAPLRVAGGQLQALQAVVHPAVATDLDLASTLATGYVLTKYVRPQEAAAAAFDRLTPDLDRDARGSMARAIDALPDGLTALAARALVPAVEGLRQASLDLEDALENVRQVLVLAGVDKRSANRPPLEQTLFFPTAALRDPEGKDLYTIESFPVVIRRFGADGTSRVLVGPTAPGPANVFVEAGTLIMAGDWLYFPLPKENAVYKVKRDGSELTAVAGGTVGPALDHPTAVARAADGSLLIGAGPGTDDAPGLLWRIAPDGTATSQAVPFPGETSSEVSALALTPDGTIWALDRFRQALAKQAPGQAWQVVATKVGASNGSHIVVQAEGGVLLARPEAHTIDWIHDDGSKTRFAGREDAPGPTGDGGPAKDAGFGRPAGLWRATDGSLLVTERGSGLVRGISREGTVQTVAGVRERPKGSPATGIDLNTPIGLAADAQGRLIVAEFGANALQRIDGADVVQLAGGAADFAGDGGPLAGARFHRPCAVAVRGDDLFVVDQQNRRIRQIDAAGKVSTVVGGGGNLAGAAPRPGTDINLDSPWAIAAAPDGSLFFSERQHICRLAPDGQVTAIAGWEDGGLGTLPPPQADVAGAPALGVEVSTPYGIAVDAEGDVYFSDPKHAVIRRVAMGTTGHPMTPYAGAGLAGLAKLIGGQAAEERDVAALEATLLLPAGLAFGPDGTLYLAEVGTYVAEGILKGGLDGLPGGAIPKLAGRIRAITRAGRAITLLGTGAPATAGFLGAPLGLAFLPDGRLAFSDSLTNQVKAIKP